MALSMSVSGGAVNARHDLDPEYRARLKNVDRSKTKDNLILAGESIEHAYERLFGEATEVYNARQVSKGRPDRQIEDYYARVRDAYRADRAKVGHSKSRSGRPAPAVEYVVQLGNRETWSRELDEEEAKAVYSEAFERIKARTAGAIDWFAAAVHVDETDGTPHMHILGIPYGESQNRGLPVQVSMNKALKTMGLDRLPDLQDALMGCLEDAARDHGVERAVMDDHHRHMDVPQFKRAMRELDEINDRKEASRQEVSDLAKLAGVTRGLVNDAQTEERAARAREEDARAGLECLQRKGIAAQGRIGEFEKAIAAERDRIDLENQVVEFFEGCRDSRDAFERIDRLKREVEEGEREAGGGEVKAENLESRADRASEQVAELRDRVEGLEAERSGLVESIERLGRRIADTARRVTDKIKALFARDETPAKVRQYAGSALSCLPVEQQAEVEAARAASAARVAEARRRLAPALEAYRLDVKAYRREFAAVAKSASGTDYSEFPRPRVPVPDDELAKYEPLAADAYIAAKTACDRLVDKYAVNLPDGGDLNDGSTASPATQAAQPARTQDRSIERFGGTRER
uniref:plasmid recombination protein n=1 Tax=Collinsella sp. TaxID=1965294 RepID=UPI003FF0A3AD